MKVTSLSDIAGRVARETHGADTVTVGGVCIPTGAISFIRKKIPRDFPKWRNASDSDIEFILKIILRESLSISGIVLRKPPDIWDFFWNDAETTHAKTSQLSSRTMSFVKAATIIKFALFGKSATLATAHAIKIGGIPNSIHSGKKLLIERSLVFDKEIEGKDNLEALISIVEASNLHQPKTNQLGVCVKTVDVKLTTEQQEPLLLLPDYVAGIVHAAHSTVDTLYASNVSYDGARSAQAALLKSKKYIGISEDFNLRYFDIFPDLEKLTTTGLLKLPPSFLDSIEN